MSARAPAWARALLRWVVRSDRIEDMLGDLDEAHAVRRARHGRLVAWLASSCEATDIALTLLVYRIRDVHPIRSGRLSWSEVTGIFRALRAHPLLSATAALALATGIGIATTGYGLVDSVLWGRVPWPGGERFVFVSAYSRAEGETVPLDPDILLTMRRETGLFEDVGLLDATRLDLQLTSGELEPLDVVRVSPALFHADPVNPRLGRLLTPDDALRGAPPVVLLSERLWASRFGSDSAVVGHTARISGTDYRIVGVIPDSYRAPIHADAWIPFREPSLATSVEGRAFAVLRPGVTRKTAQARLDAVVLSAAGGSNVRVLVQRLQDTLVDGPVRRVLMALIGALILLLVVTAANVANLFYARARARAGELAVRTALGASRTRLVVQLGSEMAVIALIAAAVGLGASVPVMHRLQRLAANTPWVDFSLDASKLLFLLATILLAVGIAGVWPALRATRHDPLAELRRNSRGTSHTLGRAGAVMIVVEMAVSVALLGVATVFARAFAVYANPDVPLPRDELVIAWVERPGDEPAQALVDAVARIPGVKVATAATALPRQEPPSVAVVPEVPDDATAGSRGAAVVSRYRHAAVVAVLPRFFDAVSASPIVGRVIGPMDMEKGAEPVAVVNEPFVRAVLGGGQAVGRRILVGGTSREIVGVVPDLGMTLRDPTHTAGLYIPLSAETYEIIVRARNPLRLSGKIRAAVTAVDPRATLGVVLPWKRIASTNVALMRGASFLLLGLGAVAMLLSLVTFYAVTSYAVTRRTREIGIRVALGEGNASVLRRVVGGTVIELALGGIIGGGVGWLFLRSNSVFTSHLPPIGPWTFPAVWLVLALAATAASWAPARRALAIQPMEALGRE